MPVLRAPTGMETKESAVAPIATTRPSTPIIAVRRNPHPPAGRGQAVLAHKYPEMKYLAYFQAYTNTYGELEDLKRKYEEALSADGVVGLVIGTRPTVCPTACWTIWRR